MRWRQAPWPSTLRSAVYWDLILFSPFSSACSSLGKVALPQAPRRPDLQIQGNLGTLLLSFGVFPQNQLIVGGRDLLDLGWNPIHD